MTSGGVARNCPPDWTLGKGTTVPSFATAHTFYASRDGLRRSDFFLWTVPPNSKVFLRGLLAGVSPSTIHLRAAEEKQDGFPFRHGRLRGNYFDKRGNSYKLTKKRQQSLV